MTSRARIVTVSVAVCAVVVVASAAVGVATWGPPAARETVDEVAGTNFSGVDGPATATSLPEETGLDRASLPERQPDNETYRSIVVFRNDDIQSNYEPETMRAVDSVFVNQSVPVTLAVIPRMGDENVSETETCEYLTRLKRAQPTLFELSLHGYTHENTTGFYGASEFGNLSAGEQDARIARGKAIMEECTGLSPRSFVPPFNTYDANTTAALRHNGINTVSAGGWFTNEYYNRTDPSAFRSDGVIHVPSTQSFVRNWTTDAFYSQERLETEFDRAYRNRSVYVQLLHYPSFDTEEKRDRLRELIRYMKSHDGVKFMTVEEYARALRAGTLTRTPDGWRYSNATANGSGGANATVADVSGDGITTTDRTATANATNATTTANQNTITTANATATNATANTTAPTANATVTANATATTNATADNRTEAAS